MKDIQEQIISFNKSERGYAPQFIVIHDTGDPKATAQNEHDYFSGGDRGASADYFVDSDNIIQIIDTDNCYSWHCGDGHGAYGISNSNSQGIEMCIGEDGQPTDATVSNTLDLVKYLMNKYNIPIERVVRHYDASKKQCPNSFSTNNWARWWDFKEQLSSNAKTGKWILNQTKNKWWYQYSDSTFPKDCWLKIDCKWYLFDVEGYMLYDWKSDGGKWYYLGNSNDGSMKIGWQFINSKWYLFNDSGAMLKGWQQVFNKWYFLNDDGSMAIGWIKYKDNDYLLYSDGSMVHDCNLYGYSFNSDGIATKLN